MSTVNPGLSVANSEEVVRISSDGIFYTLQGEGPLVGTPSIFVRFDTCNLRCKWGNTECDAHYTSWRPGQLRVSLAYIWDSILKLRKATGCNHLVITGGEPTLQEEAFRGLVHCCYGTDIHTTVETNGTNYVDAPVDLVCISPKLRSSVPVGTKYEKMHEKNRWNVNDVRLWTRYHPYYFKFVIDREEDIGEVLQMLRDVGQPLPDPEHVVLMPQGITAQELWERGRWVAAKCKELGARFTPRIQVDLWGNTPGT